jgi:NAD(P)-dependent dehydrogenase (short-subunit alcohol dehydrogenase family)
VEQGHQVTLHARNEQRAADVRAVLPDVPVVLGDLGSIDETRSVAAQVAEAGRPDAVIPTRLSTTYHGGWSPRTGCA